MKILISCIHYPIASGRYIARALLRLGHDVKTIGPSTGDEIWGMRVNAKYIWQPDEMPQDWQPDLWIHADSAMIPPLVSNPIVLWGVDNHVRDYQLRDWSMMFLAHSWGKRMDEPNAHWLPCAYDPMLHYNKHEERDIDVAIVGVPYPERVEIVQKMSEAGLKVAACTGLLFEEYNDLYNRAKIALVKSVCGDLPQRTFENMAQGCCVLSDWTPDLFKVNFEPFKDVWIYNGADDAVNAAQYLIESGDWRDIAANAKDKLHGHTWGARAQQLINTWETSQ